MKRSGIISLLTDFGNRDGYVAAMKAVILRINPLAHLIDLSHDIEPQNVQAGAFLLSSHTKFFPSGTVHLAVVDPGVGTKRRLLAVETGEQIYVAPDNGLLDFCLEQGVSQAVEITEEELWRQPVAATFHGRDILAPVAAHLSAGLPLERVGKPAPLAPRLPRLACLVSADEITGQVTYVDHFGNLITNIPARYLREFGGAGDLEIFLENHVVGALTCTYADVESGAVAAMVGGFDFLEIGINRGSAALYFAARIGAPVMVRKKL